MGVYALDDWRCVICGMPEFQGCDCRDDALEKELDQVDEQADEPIWKERGFRTYEDMCMYDERVDRGVDVGD